MQKFRLRYIKTYTISELYYFRAKAILSQGNGHLFSQILENRIDKIGKELERRGEIIKN